jgi:RIO kinase 2
LQFIEEDIDDTDSDREESEDKQFVDWTEANVKGLSSLPLEELVYFSWLLLSLPI